MQLYPFQKEAYDSVFREWDKGIVATLLVQATGTGKTIVFCKISEELVTRGKNVLILAHRKELLDQAADKLMTATGLGCAIERADYSSIDTWFRITVGSVQSLCREKRLKQFKPDHFDYIIIDEAHHTLAKSYRKILDYFDVKILGVTATPDRGDLEDLGQVFQTVAFEYTLPQAIREGYLCKLKALTLPLKIDISNVGMSGGDFKVSDLGNALDPYLEQIVQEMKVHCKGRKTVIYLPLIRTGQKMCDILNANGFRAVEINGKSKTRDKDLKDYVDGKYDVLCNSMLYTEGWDCPEVDCIICLRPTKSRPLYAQIIGRGTRLFPGKEYLMILDFLWHTSTHELCRPAYLVTDNNEVAQNITKKMEVLAESGNPELVEIEDELLEKAEGEVSDERELYLAEKLKSLQKKKRQLVDPLKYEMSIHADDIKGYVPEFIHEMAPPSKKQIAALEKVGIFGEAIENSGKASMLLDRLSKRRSSGLSSPKQIRLLETRYDFENVGDMSFHEANILVGKISANGWKVPNTINPKTYNKKPVEQTTQTEGQSWSS